MFSVETQVNKLVITHFSAQLKTFAITAIVEVGRVWLELPSPIILLNQIQAVLGNRIQLGL